MKYLLNNIKTPCGFSHVILQGTLRGGQSYYYFLEARNVWLNFLKPTEKFLGRCKI